MQSRKYTDKDGVERTSVEVVAHEMLMLDSRPAATPAGEAGPVGARPLAAVGVAEATADLPF